MSYNPSSSRRAFLGKACKSLETLILANTAIYAVGVAYKDFDGKLTAGAKTCSWQAISSVLDIGPNTCTIVDGDACSTANQTTTCREANDKYTFKCICN